MTHDIKWLLIFIGFALILLAVDVALFKVVLASDLPVWLRFLLLGYVAEVFIIVITRRQNE